MLIQGQINPGKLASEKMWYWWGCSVVNRLASSLLDLDVVEQSPMPPGPKIITPNHPTTIDPFVLLTLAPEQISILVTGGAFNVPLFGRILRRSGHIPVVRGEGRRAFEEVRRRLEEGRSIGIAPEGALSALDDSFPRARSGAARLALLTGAPVIPVGIHLERDRIRYKTVTMEGKPATARFYRGPYAVTVGNSMYFNGDMQDHTLVKFTTERIMRRIIQLSRESAIRMHAKQSLQFEPLPRTGLPSPN